MNPTMRPALLALALLIAACPAFAQSGGPVPPTPAPEQTTTEPPQSPPTVETTPGAGAPNGKPQPGSSVTISPEPFTGNSDLTWSFPEAPNNFEYNGSRNIGYLLRRDSRYPLLSRIVNIKLNHATLPQFAETLTRASGLKINVAPVADSPERVTVDAQSVPVATILEAVAQQAHLMITREAEGVGLKPWPSLTVNNQKQIEYTGHLAPWADDWATPANTNPGNMPGTAAANDFTRHQKGPDGKIRGGMGNFDNILPEVGQPIEGAPMAANNTPYGNMVVGQQAPMGYAVIPMTLTALSDTKFVVAEPATGPRGEIGIQLTVYQLQNNQLVRVSSIFHKSAVGNGNPPRTYLQKSNSIPLLGDLPGVGPLFRTNGVPDVKLDREGADTVLPAGPENDGKSVGKEAPGSKANKKEPAGDKAPDNDAGKKASDKDGEDTKRVPANTPLAPPRDDSPFLLLMR